MLIHIRENIQYYLMVILWVLAGAFLGDMAIVLVVPSLMLLLARERFGEILIAFWLILIFSDSRLDTLLFAQLTKKVVIVLLVFFLFLKRKVLAINSNGIFNIFIPFFFWSFCMTFRNPDIATSLQKTFSYVFLFLVVPIFGHQAMVMNQRTFFRTTAFSIAFFLLFGLGMRFFNLETVLLDGRFMGLMGNPNGLGLLVFIFGILFDTICRKDPEVVGRRLKIIIWGLIIGNLLLCQSRTSLFAFIIYLVFANYKVLRGFLGFLAFVILSFSYGYIVSNIKEVVNKLGLDGIIRVENIEEGSGRIIAWQFAWEQIQDNIMIGRGFSYTEWIFSTNYRMLSQMGHLGNAHNSYLTFWLDTGLIGLVIFLIAFILLFIRLAKASSTAMPLLYAILISSFFESWLTASLNPNTICVLLIMTIMMYASEESEEDGMPTQLEEQSNG